MHFQSRFSYICGFEKQIKIIAVVSQKTGRVMPVSLESLQVIYRISECLVAFHAELQEEIAHKVNGGPRAT